MLVRHRVRLANKIRSGYSYVPIVPLFNDGWRLSLGCVRCNAGRSDLKKRVLWRTFVMNRDWTRSDLMRRGLRLG